MNGLAAMAEPVGAAATPRVEVRDWVLVLGLVALAFAIRLVGLTVDALWFDEAATVEIAALPFADIFGPVAAMESSPPGFYAIARLWIMAFGSDTATLRLLPALAGALTVIPAWLFARDLAGERAGWIVGGLMALTASQVRLSQDARTYTLLCLLSAVALLLALRLARRPALDRRAVLLILGFGAAQGLMLWLHGTASVQIAFLGAFLLIAGSLGPLGFRRTGAVALLSGLMAAIIGALPLSYAVAHVLQPEFADRWIDEPDLIESLRVYGRTLIAPFLHRLSPVAGLLAGALLAAAALDAVRRRDAPRIALVLAVGAIGVLLPGLSNLVPIMLDRTILFLLLPVQALLAAGAVALPRRLFMPAVAMLLGLHAVGLVQYYRTDTRKEPWPALAATLHGLTGPGTPIIATEGIFAARALSVAMGAEAPRIIATPPDVPLEHFVARHRSQDVATDPAELCRLLEGTESVWLVGRNLPAAVADDPGYTARRWVTEALTAAGASLRDDRSSFYFLTQRWSPPRCRRG